MSDKERLLQGSLGIWYAFGEGDPDINWFKFLSLSDVTFGVPFRFLWTVEDGSLRPLNGNVEVAIYYWDKNYAPEVGSSDVIQVFGHLLVPADVLPARLFRGSNAGATVTQTTSRLTDFELSFCVDEFDPTVSWYLENGHGGDRQPIVMRPSNGRLGPV